MFLFFNVTFFTSSGGGVASRSVDDAKTSISNDTESRNLDKCVFLYFNFEMNAGNCFNMNF